MIAVIKGVGNNLASIEFALQRLGAQYQLTDDAREINMASKVLLPGVGTARNAMSGLKAKKLVQTIQKLSVPVLGICVGMQILFDQSAEESTQCLGIIPGRVDMLKAKRIPHMGWNKVSPVEENDLIKASQYAYFVHSFIVPISGYTRATCDYGGAFSAMVQRDNFFGVQFHPEKSDVFGEQVLKNFLEVC